MRGAIQAVLERYGQPVMLHLADGNVAVKAFLQPMASPNEQVPGEMTEVGSIDGRLWLYMGQAAVEADDRMEWNGTEFRVRSSRPYYAGNTLLYWWAVLEQAKEAAI